MNLVGCNLKVPNLGLSILFGLCFSFDNFGGSCLVMFDLLIQYCCPPGDGRHARQGGGQCHNGGAGALEGFCQGLLSGCAGEEEAPARTHKTASLQALRALDRGLLSRCGMGFGGFSLHPPMALWVPDGLPADDPEPEAPGISCLANDQAPTNLCAVYYTLYKSPVLLMHHFDQSHRWSNDILLAIGGADLYTVLLLTKTPYNVQWGPWHSQAWYRKMVQAAGRWHAESGPDDPLFGNFLPQLADDLDEGERLPEDGYAEQLHRRLFEGVDAKGPRLQLSMWASALDVNEHRQSRWTMKLLIMLRIGVTAGYMKKGDVGRHVLRIKHKKSGEDRPKGRTAVKLDAGQSEASLRALCANTLHAATLVLMDRRQAPVHEGSDRHHSAKSPEGLAWQAGD